MAIYLADKIRKNLQNDIRRGTQNPGVLQIAHTLASRPETLHQVRGQIVREVQKNEAFQELRKVYEREGAELTDREMAALSLDPPKKDPFPWLVFVLALTKDVLDFVSVSSLAPLWSGILGAILFVYYLGKLSFIHKKGIRGVLESKKLLAFGKKMAVSLGIDGLPFAGFLPISSIMVIFAHYRNVRFFRITLNATEAWQKGELRAVRQAGARLRISARKESQALSIA